MTIQEMMGYWNIGGKSRIDGHFGWITLKSILDKTNVQWKKIREKQTKHE